MWNHSLEKTRTTKFWMLYFSQHVPLYDVIQQRIKPRCCVEISAPGAKVRVLYFLFTTSETRPGNPGKRNKRRYAYIDFPWGRKYLEKILELWWSWDRSRLSEKKFQTWQAHLTTTSSVNCPRHLTLSIYSDIVVHRDIRGLCMFNERKKKQHGQQ